MKKLEFKINNIEALILGDPSDKVFLFVHGKGGNKEEAIPFADVACKKGYQVLSIDLPKDLYPWTVVPILKHVMKYINPRWSKVAIRANSIGALFSMMVFQNINIEKCLFVSPIVDMVKLIETMMLWASVTKEELREKKNISTGFGENLSWEYYTYILENQIKKWNPSTYILYGEKDNLTDTNTIEAFAKKYNCQLTTMKNGEHWFHTEAQLDFMKKWESDSINNEI